MRQPSFRSRKAASLQWGLAVLCLGLLALAGCEQGGSCDLVKVGQVQLEPRGRLFTVPVTVNDRPIHMLLDTGARASILTEAAVKRLSVTRDGRTATVVTGMSGGSMRTDANIDSMRLGDAPLDLRRIPVAYFGDYRGIDGIIGLDVLRDYDLDIDAPKHVLTLYRIRQCERADPPWDEPAIPIAGTSTMTGWMDIPFEINGSAQTAMVDTGSSYTEIAPRLLRRIGLSAQDLANDRTLNLHVVAGDDVQVQVHRFQTIRIGAIAMNDTTVVVLAKDPPALSGGRRFHEAMIGQDFLGTRRVWFSFKTDRLYISRKDNDTATVQ
jgi:predicted aspartyl protease